MRNKINRTREQQLADKIDYEVYHLAVKAERQGGREWQVIAEALRAVRPLARAKMHPADYEQTKG